MNYYQVEFKNPDDFFKTQTNDFITSNHLIFLKEGESYYLISQENYNDQEIMKKINDFFDYEFLLAKVEPLIESDFIKKLGRSDIGDLVKFLLSAEKERFSEQLKPNLEKLDELNDIIALIEFKGAIREFIDYISFQEKISNNENQQHFYIFTGEKGTGRKFAIKFLESIFGMNAIFVNCNHYFVPKMSEKDFAVLVDYLSARSKTKSDIFDNFRQKKGNSFNIIISRSNQEAEAIRKELLEDFNKVTKILND